MAFAAHSLVRCTAASSFRRFCLRRSISSSAYCLKKRGRQACRQTGRQTDGQTDRQVGGLRGQRPHIRFCGKNEHDATLGAFCESTGVQHPRDLTGRMTKNTRRYPPRSRQTHKFCLNPSRCRQSRCRSRITHAQNIPRRRGCGGA